VNLEWTVPAANSLRAALQFIHAENPDAAHEVAIRIKDAVARLATFPRMGRSGLHVGTRELIIPGLPYYVVYRVTDTEVQVLRVFHAKQERQ
jgi:toxin ParE1/3/4